MSLRNVSYEMFFIVQGWILSGQNSYVPLLDPFMYWWASISWLLWIMLQLIWECICLFKLVFWVSLDKYPEVELLLCLLLYSLCFKVCFVWYKYCYPSFLFVCLFPFSQNTFFHSFTFTLCVSFNLKWVSCRQHV